MRILIGIATYKRINKLKRLIDSLKYQTYKDFRVVIVSDNNDFETRKWVHSQGYNFPVHVNDEHKYVIGAWNYCVSNYINCEWDAFIGLCDDVELYPNALEEIVKCHKENFPDTDGVCGFHQACEGYPNYIYKPFGQTLMGRKFIERYKDVDYKICCPDFYHFVQDECLYNYANSLNKFKLCKDAVLNHDHPSFTGNIDETHNIIRSGKKCPKKHDFEMQRERQKLGYLWGKNFNLIGKKSL